jgi:hypothetical protein
LAATQKIQVLAAQKRERNQIHRQKSDQNISEGQQKERVKPQRPPHESLHIQHFARSSESEGMKKQHTVSTNAAIKPLTSTPNRKWLITPDAC